MGWDDSFLVLGWIGGVALSVIAVYGESSTNAGRLCVELIDPGALSRDYDDHIEQIPLDERHEAAYVGSPQPHYLHSDTDTMELVWMADRDLLLHLTSEYQDRDLSLLTSTRSEATQRNYRVDDTLLYRTSSNPSGHLYGVSLCGLQTPGCAMEAI